MSWIQTQAYLNRIAKRGIKPGLQRMQALLRIFGNPERQFRSLHITGTNGKGSVCAMLASILNSSGIRAGLYTSPHLTELRERITVRGRPIRNDDISRWVRKIRSRSGRLERDLTYFEILTGVAFCYFAQMRVELAVVEVGLGGRLDATNVLVRPEVCIITNIGLEHSGYLGNTIEKIASEKCGILKENSHCITAAQGTALRVIRKNSALTGIQIDVISTKRRIAGCALKGSYQAGNIGIVMKTVRVLRKKGWLVPATAVTKGLKNVRLPGRFDMRTLRIQGSRVPHLMDGAHNPAAIRALVTAIRKSRLFKSRCMLIFNSLKDKGYAEMVRILTSGLKIARVCVPAIGTERSSVPQIVRKLFVSHRKDLSVQTFRSVSALWGNVLSLRHEQKKEGSWILTTGSLYLIAETLAELKKFEGRRVIKIEKIT